MFSLLLSLPRTSRLLLWLFPPLLTWIGPTSAAAAVVVVRGSGEEFKGICRHVTPVFEKATRQHFIYAECPCSGAGGAWRCSRISLGDCFGFNQTTSTIQPDAYGRFNASCHINNWSGMRVVGSAYCESADCMKLPPALDPSTGVTVFDGILGCTVTTADGKTILGQNLGDIQTGQDGKCLEGHSLDQDDDWTWPTQCPGK